MKLSHSLLSTALLARHSFATLHHMFVSSYTTPDIWTLELDDVRKTLKPIGNTTGHDGHPVLAFSYDRSIVYGGEVSGYSSYHIGGDNPYALTYNSSIGLGGDCATKANKNGYGSTAIAAEAKGPYMVYGAPLAGCGQANAVNTDLDLDFITQNFTYNRPTSAIRGLALDIDNTILYSADVGASGVWAHSIDSLTGVVTSIGFLPSHIPNAGPRKIVTHPSGKYIYVLLERANIVAVYAVNRPKDGTPPKQGPISFTGLTYSLLPSNEISSNFWASDMSISEDGSRLIATTRYKLPSQLNSVDTVPIPAAPRPAAPQPQPQYNPYNQNGGQQYPAYTQNQPAYNQPSYNQQQPYRGGQQQQQPYYNNNGGRGKNNAQPARPAPRDDDDFKTKEKRRTGVGYVTAILLTPATEAENADTGANVGWGYPIRRLFQTQTSTSGGMSNHVSAAPWGDSFFALTDSEFGVVEVWKIEGLDIVDYGGALGQDALTKGIGGWSLGQWSPTGQLAYSEATDNPGNSAVAQPVNNGGWREGQPRAQVPESYYNPPPKATAAAPVYVAPAPTQGTSNLPPWLGGSSDPNSFAPNDPYLSNLPNQGNSAVQVGQQDAASPASAASAPSPSPSKSWFGSLFGFKRTNEADDKAQLSARQVAAPAAAAPPPITARVFAYWRAPAVQSKFPQAGCCSNPLWYD